MNPHTTNTLDTIKINDTFILEYFATHIDVNIEGVIKLAIYNRENTSKQTSTPLFTDDENIILSKSDLKVIYSEYSLFLNMRNEFLEQAKNIKNAKLPFLLQLCESNLDIKKTFIQCPFCPFHAKNTKSLALHARKCNMISTNLEDENQEDENDET